MFHKRCLFNRSSLDSVLLDGELFVGKVVDTDTNDQNVDMEMSEVSDEEWVGMQSKVSCGPLEEHLALDVSETNEEIKVRHDVSNDNEKNTHVCGQQAFSPGSIHRDTFRPFWRDTLKASPWVMDFLDKGYKIPFSSLPGPYEEENNMSAKKDMKTVRKIVQDMIDKKIVKATKIKPRCVSPLGLVSKLQDDGTIKHRLIFDASRWLNKFIEDQKVTLAHLDKALGITEKGDWQVVFDLKSAYYHIRICEEQQDLLGAAIKNSDGSTQYFVYQHLPFGIKCAVHAITKIWKPLLAHLQILGIRSSIYIDDGRLLASSAFKAEEFRIKAYEVIRKSGWILEYEKSDKKDEASCSKLYLGFIIDTNLMSVTKKESKLREIVQECSKLCDKSTCDIRELSSVLGKMTALIPSHGHIARYCTRSGFVDSTSHVDKFGWKGTIKISEECRNEFRFFCEHASTTDALYERN